MAKLECNFSSFNTFKNSIVSKVEDYNSLLSALNTLENASAEIWNCDAQRTFYSKFMERKKDLGQLSIDYSAMISLLNDIISTYENIENSY